MSKRRLSGSKRKTIQLLAYQFIFDMLISTCYYPHVQEMFYRVCKDVDSLRNKGETTDISDAQTDFLSLSKTWAIQTGRESAFLQNQDTFIVFTEISISLIKTIRDSSLLILESESA